MRVRMIALAAFAVLASAAPARAATYTVTGTLDPGTCDGLACTGLQAALDAARADKVADEIDLKKATYAASKGFTVSDAAGVTVVGAGASATTLTTSGSGVRVVTVSGTATLTHLKVAGGTATDLTGGGVFNAGTLALDHVEVSGNRASTGAGIANQGGLTIASSLIASNVAGSGDAGILNAGPAGAPGATLAMRDSTVAFNTAGVSGVGGIAMRGGSDTGTLQRVTVADNTGGGRSFGGIALTTGAVLGARATIVAGNTGGLGANCSPTTPRDDGFDVESGSDCGFTSGKQNANPGFPSGLVRDGGETDVLPIPPGSPAVDLGPACSRVADQRDLPRPQGKACDAGAYELDQAPDMLIDSGPPALTQSSTVQFAFHSSEPGVTFQCSTGGSPATCSSPASYTLADGTYTFTVQALDGTHGPVPASATFRIDSTAPAAPVFTAPANGAALNTHSVTLQGTAEAGASVRIQEGQAVDTTVTASGTGAWSAPLTVAEGTHTYTAFATDAAGNVSPASATRTITVDTAPPAAPTITTPAGDITQNTTTVSLSGGAEPGATVVVFEGTSPRRSATANGQGLWSASFTAPDGAHTYTATAADAAGNISAQSSPRTITIDTTPPAAPVFTSPADNSLQRSATVTLGGTAEAGATVEVFEGGTSRGTTTATGGTWTRTIVLVPDGKHTYTAKATDAAGNTSSASATRTVNVDTGPPAPPVIADGPALQNSAGVALSGTAESGATVEVLEGTTSRGTTTATGGAWALTLAGVADGAHTYTARATDVAGNVSGLSAPRTVTVDTTPPPADVTGGPSGVTSETAPAFTFASPDSGATFVCRLDGPAGPGPEAPCTSPHGVGTLAPGSYTFTVRAVDAAGNSTTSARSFTVSVPQQGQPTPTPTPTPSPTPVANQSVVVQPAGGKVLVRRKGTSTFVALDATQGIPLGSEVDTRHGKVRLTSVPKAGAKPQSALFFGGLFVVTQSRGVTQLALSEPLAACPRGRTASAAKKKPKTRNLWGDGHGSFRTSGRYSAATVRGTRWNVQDSCAGTLTRVVRGVVAVRDDVRHRTIVLRAGKRYLARPRR